MWDLPRFGNPSKTHLSDLDLRIKADGPGAVEHSWYHADEHSLGLQITAKAAGKACHLSGAVT